MNIFILDNDPRKAAQYHVDKHIVKMPLETAQILCSVHHLSGTDADIPYRLTHKNHPCSIWARESLANYYWLCNFGFELCYEYTHRYGKIHKCQAVILWCNGHEPNIPSLGLTPFAQAVPDYIKNKDAVQAYRDYYANHKKHIFNWKNRERPEWLNDS